MIDHPPVFLLVPPHEVKAVSGHDLTLECVVEGAPVPVVTWSKYGGKLPNGRYKQVLGKLWVAAQMIDVNDGGLVMMMMMMMMMMMIIVVVSTWCMSYILFYV